jgi:hypothetical protein
MVKKAILIVAGLVLLTAPPQSEVSGGTPIPKQNPAVTTTTSGSQDATDHRLVAEPGTMAITSMGLLAAAALRRKFSRKLK